MKCARPIAMASRQLTDMTNVTWPTATLLTYLNAACKEISILKPEASTVTGNIVMSPGIRQAVGGKLLINAKRNMGTDGLTPGPAIRQLDRNMLDQALPDWPVLPQDSVVSFVVTDDRDPYFFDVIPPQPSNTGQKIEATYAVDPSYAADPVNDNFPLPSEYEIVAVDYMIARALAESNSIPNALAKAGSFFTRFYQALGVKGQADAKVFQEGQ